MDQPNRPKAKRESRNGNEHTRFRALVDVGIGNGRGPNIPTVLFVMMTITGLAWIALRMIQSIVELMNK